MKKNIKEYSDYHQLILDIGFMKRHWRHKYQTNVIRGFEKGKQQQNVSRVYVKLDMRVAAFGRSIDIECTMILKQLILKEIDRITIGMRNSDEQEQD